jgi:hypothetical protein
MSMTQEEVIEELRAQLETHDRISFRNETTDEELEVTDVRWSSIDDAIIISVAV